MEDTNKVFEKIDELFVPVEETKNKKDKMIRRFFITWNNPFWENQFEEIDISKTNLKQNLDKYDLSFLKEEQNKEFFDFKYIKYTNSKTKEDEVVERAFFKDDLAIQNYITLLTNFKYTCFQVEKGGNSQLIHIQAMIIFSKPVHWSTFCRRFPLADFSEIYSSNTNARLYCSKEDTRIRGPFEIGDFAEERARTDIKEFLELLDAGASNKDLKKTHPSLFLREFNKLDNLRTIDLFDEYKTKKRDIEVTYIYGPAGVGKSTYVYDLCGFTDSFSVQQYDISAFTFYSGQSILILDEFIGQFKIPYMNKLLDKFPLQLRGLNSLKWACYTKVYIISNLSLKELYKDMQEENFTLYKAFIRRLDNVIRFDAFGKFHYEKQKEKHIQEELELKEIDDLEF